MHCNSYTRNLIVLLISLISPLAYAFNQECEQDDDCARNKDSFIIPYAFYNASTDFAVAAALGASGYLQPQFDFLVNGFAGSSGSWASYFLGKDYQIQDSRWFVDSSLLMGEWLAQESYVNGNPFYAFEEAGSNNSHANNFLTTDLSDRYYRVNFRYLLPIGEGQNEIIHVFHTQHGELLEHSATGGSTWNPLKHGRTTLDIEPFYRRQVLDPDFLPKRTLKTSGIRLGLEYDNTDWYKNPTRGSKTTIGFSRDWGQSSESSTWSQIEFSYQHYIRLADTPGTRQRVLAMSLWTSDSPTWNSSHTVNGTTVYHRPPLFSGSTLGGLDRQRGFPANRFHDRAAINYQLEYRHMPARNWLMDIPLVNTLPLDWMQWVGFIEAGRVADRWSPSVLHSNMKVTVGGGLRTYMMGLVIRVDVAASEEGGELQMFVGHAF